MDPLARLIAHHASTVSLVVEAGAVVALVIALALVWWSGRRRQVNRRRAIARMRDEDDTASP